MPNSVPIGSGMSSATLAIVAAIAFEDFVTAGAVAFFALLGELVEKRTALGARVAIESLIQMTPSTALRIDEAGNEHEVEATELQPGDRVRVRPGNNVPADGVVVSGRSSLDEASITGESVPAEKGPEAEVFAGTVNLTGALEVEVSRAGPETTLGRVKELILHAEQTRPPVARVIDRYVTYYLPFVLLIAFIILFLTEEKLHSAFQHFDVDGSGSLSLSEVSDACKLHSRGVYTSACDCIAQEEPLRDENDPLKCQHLRQIIHVRLQITMSGFSTNCTSPGTMSYRKWE